ncbi:MAG: DUF6152 family protein [Caulobacteraceae bacterium]
MQVSKKMLALAGVAAVSLAAAPAFAHHSFAMFDNQKNVTLDGTVKEFQWTNPHSWIQLVVKDASGKDVEYSIEGGSPNGLSPLGLEAHLAEAGRQGHGRDPPAEGRHQRRLAGHRVGGRRPDRRRPLLSGRATGEFEGRLARAPFFVGRHCRSVRPPHRQLGKPRASFAVIR